MSFMVTIRERRIKEGLPGPLDAPYPKMRWVVTHRFEAATSKEALERVVKVLDSNPECGVSIMRKR